MHAHPFVDRSYGDPQMFSRADAGDVVQIGTPGSPRMLAVDEAGNVYQLAVLRTWKESRVALFLSDFPVVIGLSASYARELRVSLFAQTSTQTF